MRAEQRAYPSWKDDDSKGLSSMIDAELTDLSDEDEEERLEKAFSSQKDQRPQAKKGQHPQSAGQSKDTTPRPTPRARPSQNMNSHDRAHPRDHASLMSRGPVPPDRPTKAMETSAGPTTNPLTAGDQPPVNLATTDTQLHPVHKLHTLYSRSTEKTQPDRATLRATLMATTWVRNTLHLLRRIHTTASRMVDALFGAAVEVVADPTCHEGPTETQGGTISTLLARKDAAINHQTLLLEVDNPPLVPHIKNKSSVHMKQLSMHDFVACRPLQAVETVTSPS